MNHDHNSILSLKGISKSYLSGSTSHEVLSNISISFKKGEFTVILGPSGCGKSTLLKIISSMINPDSGEVYISNTPVYAPDRKRILMLQDDNQLFPWLTVKKNILFAVHSSQRERRSCNIQNLLKLTGLEKYKDYYPHQLSGGMKKRTALARALAGNPEILLLDEPFGSLDEGIRKALQQSFIRIWKEYNLTVLLVTHDIREALTSGQRIVVMDAEGSIVCDEENPMAGKTNPREEEFFNLYKRYYKLISSF